jgi:hypothetical protein
VVPSAKEYTTFNVKHSRSMKQAWKNTVKVFICNDHFEVPREPSTISLSTVELKTDVETCTAIIEWKI